MHGVKLRKWGMKKRMPYKLQSGVCRKKMGLNERIEVNKKMRFEKEKGV